MVEREEGEAVTIRYEDARKEIHTTDTRFLVI